MAVKLYASKEPGYKLALSKELEEEAFRVFNRRSLLFPANKPVLLLGSDDATEAKFYDKLTKYVEESKPFKGGKIFRVPTEAEIVEKQKQEANQRYLEHIKGNIDDGLIDLQTLTAEQLTAIAAKAGLDTTGTADAVRNRIAEATATELAEPTKGRGRGKKAE